MQPLSSPSSVSTNESREAHCKSKPLHRWIIRCSGCKEIIRKNEALTGNVVSCLKRFWHRSHFKCAKCDVIIGADERDFRVDPCDEHRPLCIDCFMDDYHPPCEICSKALRETCMVAMDKRMHHDCFVCMRCGLPFPDGEYIILNDKMYDEDCYYVEKSKVFLANVGR